MPLQPNVKKKDINRSFVYIKKRHDYIDLIPNPGRRTAHNRRRLSEHDKLRLFVVYGGALHAVYCRAICSVLYSAVHGTGALELE